MPLSYAQYAGNGSSTTFSVPFPYLLKAHVKLYTGFNILTGSYTTQLAEGTDYSWTSGTQIQTAVAPASGVTLTVLRDTPDGSQLVPWQDGSNLTADDLNSADLQNLYVVQEQQDRNDAGATAAIAAQTAANSATAAATAATTAANTANATAAAATTAANNATTAANASVSASTAATATANQASSDAAAAISTANTAATNASTALSTANTATTTANGAVTTANTAASNASAAVSTANTAATNASAAVSTANASAAASSNAVTTANLTVSVAQQAANTANSANSTASNAVSTANSATSTANSALSTANSAVATANAATVTANNAASAVANAVLYAPINNVASIPASPSNNTYIEVIDSTGIQSFTPLVGLPAGFIGDSGLTVRLRYTAAGTTWNFLNYYANNPETRYLPLFGGALTGQLRGDDNASAATPGFAFDGDPDTGLGRPGANELALITGGVARLTFDSAGAAAFTGSVTIPAGSTVAGYLTTASAASTYLTQAAALSTYQTQQGMSSYLTIGAADIAYLGKAQAASTYAPLNAPSFTGLALFGLAGVNNAIRFSDADQSNYVGLKAPTAVPADITFSLPSVDGTNGQFLITDGSGNLGWGTPSAGVTLIDGGNFANGSSTVNTSQTIDGGSF